MVEEKPRANIKVVVVGDGYCGKTCLVTAYGENKYPGENATAVSDTYDLVAYYEDEEVNLKLWDTAG